jgi:hypothetical protein
MWGTQSSGYRQTSSATHATTENVSVPATKCHFDVAYGCKTENVEAWHRGPIS